MFRRAVKSAWAAPVRAVRCQKKPWHFAAPCLSRSAPPPVWTGEARQFSITVLPNNGDKEDTGADGLNMEESGSQHACMYLKEVDSSTLLILCAQGVEDASAELLVRDIVRVDGVPWNAAWKRLEEIKASCKKQDWVMDAPYHVAFWGAVSSAIVSIPLVFHWRTAVWFDENFVEMELPDVKEVQTILEIGAWTWNYMEPPLGVASFVMLALQVSRAQMLNLGWKPYTGWCEQRRCLRVATEFPKYQKKLVMNFAKHKW